MSYIHFAPSHDKLDNVQNISKQNKMKSIFQLSNENENYILLLVR